MAEHFLAIAAPDSACAPQQLFLAVVVVGAEVEAAATVVGMAANMAAAAVAISMPLACFIFFKSFHLKLFFIRQQCQY